MSVKQLTFNTLVYAIGPQIPKLVSVLILPFITPYLTPNDYGVYGPILAYTTAITSLKDLGLTTVLSVSFYKFENRYRFIWNKIFSITSIWAIPLSLLLAIILWIVIPVNEMHNYIPIVICTCIPLLIFEPTKWIGRKYFQLIQKPLPIVIINGIAAILGILSNYLTIKVLGFGYLGWFIAAFIISFVSFLPYLWAILKIVKIKYDFKINKKWIYRYLAIGIPVLPHAYSVYLLDTSDRLLLNWFNVSISDIGIYSLAYGLGGYFAIVGNALGEAAGPMYIKLFKKESIKDEIRVRNLTFLMQGFTLMLAFIISVWAKEWFELLIKNDALQFGYVITIVIIMSYSYRPISFGPINKLQYLYKTKVLWKISFMAGIVNVILNIALIPLFGIWGSVIATFMSLMFLGFRGYWLKDFKENNQVNYYPFFWLITICLLTICVFLIKDISVIYKILITVILILISVICAKKFKHLLIF